VFSFRIVFGVQHKDLNQTYIRKHSDEKTFNGLDDFIYQPDLFGNNRFWGRD